MRWNLRRSAGSGSSPIRLGVPVELGAFLSVRFHFVVFLCRRNQESAFHFRKEPRWRGLTFALQCGNEKLNTSLPAATATYCAVSTA